MTARRSSPVLNIVWIATLLLLARPAAAQTPASTTVAAGAQHTLVAAPDGTVWAFGGNGNGELGDNSTTVRRVPQLVPGLSNIIAVAAGTSHSLALSSSGTVYAFGDNAYSQLGDGTTTDRRTPLALPLTNVVAIAAGDYHSLALRDNGDVYIWGRNNSGQIGNGTTTNVSAPWLLTSGAHAVAAGGSHTLMVKTDGTVWGTGADSYGQLGTGSTASSRTALVQATGLTTVVAASGGSKHSVFLLADGTVRAAGYGGQGQLGRGLTSNSSTPVDVVGLTGISAIDAGADHALAAASNGTLYSWGELGTGKLGTNAAAHQLTPVAVDGAGPVSAFSAGGDHSLSVTTSGVVHSFGENGTSQLGDGATSDQPLPLAISEAGFAWRVATPTFNVAAGTYTSERTVTVAVVTAGATIHYTQTGADPTESDPVIASGSSVSVTQSQTLKARAWKSGVPTSHVATAEYVLKPVTPTISPAAGTYTSARTVTISTSTAGATLRYTLDGTDPTSSSTLYTGSFTVATTMTVKAVAFKGAWADSDVRSVAYTMSFGTLTTPTVSPAAGTFTGQVSVTLSAQPFATIRYTTNGATPTTASPIYAGPIAVTDTSTVRAKAFHQDYTASGVAAESYTLVTSTPVFSLASGEYAPGTAVTITSPDAGATLRWTLDGTDPMATSQILPAGPLPLGPYTVKVRASRSGASDSAVATATYALTAPLGSGAVSVGDSHVLLATPEGMLYAWGTNSNSQVGDGTATARSTPVLIPTVTGITSVAAGGMHSLAVNTVGEAWAWGNDSYGAVGDGAPGGAQSRPRQVVGVPAIAAVAAGASHSLVLTTGGEVYAFGLGTSGQLGQGTTAASATPLLVPGLADVVAIAAAGSQSFAVTASGELWAWGANAASQLGDGTTTPRTLPTRIANVSDVVTVAAGMQHTVARTRSGALWVWGDGTSGKLGLGGTASHSTPVLLPNTSGAVLDAGANHTLLLSGTSAVLGWGANNFGQVGIGTTATVLQPTAAIGLSGITTLALGGSTSVAVALDGGVWTWGAGGAVLGDGTSSSRSTPALAWTAPGRWSTPPPTLSLGSGTFSTEQVVLITSAVPGATLRYTTNGQDPTEMDPEVPANGDVLITASATLKARAWVPGRAPSGITAAIYTLQFSTPVIVPGAGTFTTPQLVTMSTSSVIASLRYTLDGTEPHALSPLYTDAIGIEASTTVMARAFAEGWTPSGIATAFLGFNYGTLARPTASTPSGTYAPGEAVALTAEAGAIIRYTLDGSSPTESAAIYTAPIVLPEGGSTLIAQAVRADWTSSALLTESYVIGSTPLSITAIIVPAANAAGWHQGPATVSFTCAPTGVACPAAVTVSTEGDHTVSKIVTLGGQTAETSVRLQIDKTPPFLQITAPPAEAVVPVGPVEVTGLTGDTRSAVAVSCDGVAATLTASGFMCSYQIPAGGATLTVAATDEAGQVRTRTLTVHTDEGVTTEPTSLAVTPTAATLRIGESRTFAVRDQLGRVPPAVWSVDDETVVAVETVDGLTVTGLAAGTATLTATWRGVSASVDVTVMAVSELPVGTVLWTGPTLPGGVRDIVQATTLEGERRLYAIEEMGTGQNPPHRLAALTADGRTEWTKTLVGTTSQVSGTPFGGVAVAHRPGGGDLVIRVFGPEGGATDVPDVAGGGFAIHPAGPLYHIAASTGDLVGANIGLGEGGRHALPTGLVRQCTGREPDAPGTCTETPAFFGSGTPTVMADGTVVVPVETSRKTSYSPQGTIPAHEAVLQYGLTMFYLRPDGTTETRALFGPPPGHSGWSFNRSLSPFKAIPDGEGGVVVGWTTSDVFADRLNYHVHVARVMADGTVLGWVGPVGDRIDGMVLGEDGTVLVTTYMEDGRKAGLTYLSPAMSIMGYEILQGREVSTVMAEGGPSPGFLINFSDGVVQSADPGFSGLSLTRSYPLGANSWIGMSTQQGGASSLVSATVLTALVAPTLSTASSEWTFPAGGELAQNRARGVYTDPDLAAREYLEVLWGLSFQYEFGALVCESSGRYSWSRFDTSKNPWSVETRKLVSCGLSRTWAVLHAHTPLGEPTPSHFSSGQGSDVMSADAEPNLRFYLAAPTPNHAPPEPRKWRYQGPNSQVTAMTWNGTAWVPTPIPF